MNHDTLPSILGKGKWKNEQTVKIITNIQLLLSNYSHSKKNSDILWVETITCRSKKRKGVNLT